MRQCGPGAEGHMLTLPASIASLSLGKLGHPWKVNWPLSMPRFPHPQSQQQSLSSISYSLHAKAVGEPIPPLPALSPPHILFFPSAAAVVLDRQTDQVPPQQALESGNCRDVTWLRLVPQDSCDRVDRGQRHPWGSSAGMRGTTDLPQAPHPVLPLPLPRPTSPPRGSNTPDLIRETSGSRCSGQAEGFRKDGPRPENCWDLFFFGPGIKA